MNENEYEFDGMTNEDILQNVSTAALELWCSPRPKRAPTNAEKALYQRRSEAILQIALNETTSFSQTVRRIYYVCSGLGIVNKDHGEDKKGYTAVQEALLKYRWSGALPWERIIDGSRELSPISYWNDAQSFLTSVKPWFETDFWTKQRSRVIVVFEKDTLQEMLGHICSEYQVPTMSFHGQVSDSALYTLAKRISSMTCEEVWLYYLGDYDPSGLVIDGCVFGREGKYEGKLRDILLNFFPNNNVLDIYRRIGIVQKDLSNPEYDKYLLPASTTDKNYNKFLALTDEDDRTLGIDALDHAELDRRVREVIDSNIDKDLWAEEQQRYEQEKQTLR